MAEMVRIRSVKQFFNTFIAEPAQKNGLQWLSRHTDEIKAQLIDAFRKEIFGQIVFKFGPKVKDISRDELANLDGIQNILQQSFRKWRRLCILCGESGIPFISLEDLEEALKEDDADDSEENTEEASSSEEM